MTEIKLVDNQNEIIEIRASQIKVYIVILTSFRTLKS